MTLTSEGHDKLCWKPEKNKVLRFESTTYPSLRPLTLFSLEMCVALKDPS